MFKKLLSTLLFLIFLASVTLLFLSLKNPEIGYYIQSLVGVAPCQKTIKYSLGDIDPRFNLEKSELLQTLLSAEKIWEDAKGGELFEYAPTGKLKINFVYDSRQEATEKLKDISGQIDSTSDSYERLKSELTVKRNRYEADSTRLQALISEINSAKSRYDAEVVIWNKKGGAPKTTFDSLNAERNRIQIMIDEAQKLQNNIVVQIGEINALVDSLNAIAKSINAGVETYNKIGTSNGKEFEEGLYIASALSKEIIIYQFKDQNQLLRVLAHEFGHALGLEHISDEKSIMYELNQSTNLIPTDEDKAELKAVCRSN